MSDTPRTDNCEWEGDWPTKPPRGPMFSDLVEARLSPEPEVVPASLARELEWELAKHRDGAAEILVALNALKARFEAALENMVKRAEVCRQDGNYTGAGIYEARAEILRSLLEGDEQ